MVLSAILSIDRDFGGRKSDLKTTGVMLTF